MERPGTRFAVALSIDLKVNDPLGYGFPRVKKIVSLMSFAISKYGRGSFLGVTPNVTNSEPIVKRGGCEMGTVFQIGFRVLDLLRFHGGSGIVHVLGMGTFRKSLFRLAGA